MVLSSAAPMSINGAFGTVCPAGSLHSEILYIVILTINAPYTLYVVFVLIWLPGIYCHWYRVTKEGKPISMSNQNPFADPSVISFADFRSAS